MKKALVMTLLLVTGCSTTKTLTESNTICLEKTTYHYMKTECTRYAPSGSSICIERPAVKQYCVRQQVI